MVSTCGCGSRLHYGRWGTAQAYPRSRHKCCGRNQTRRLAAPAHTTRGFGCWSRAKRGVGRGVGLGVRHGGLARLYKAVTTGRRPAGL
eukprot:359804-Chlamydomonas_euryale.AAC.12